MPGGRSDPAALIAACTSFAAPSTLRERSNCTTMEVVPRPEVEVISDTPAMAPRRRSSGAATAEPPPAVDARAQRLHRQVDHRRGVERDHLAQQQPADDGDAERQAQLRA